jgi:small-conductance mechanosensitive channel
MLAAFESVVNSFRESLSFENLKSLIGTVLVIALIIAISALVMRIVNSRLTAYLLREDKRYMSERRAKTLVPLLKSIVRYLVYLIAGLTILSKLGVPIGSLLAAAGIGGVAIGFGAQSLVRDVITGFFILFEDQFAVGDHVSLSGVSGTVEEMTLRVTKIRDFGGQLHIVPNGQINQVTNHMGSRMRVLFEITVPIDVDGKKVEEILCNLFKKFAKEHSEVQEGPSLLGVSRVDHTGVSYQLIAKTDPGQQWAVERELRGAVWKELIAHGIYPAVPQQELRTSDFRKFD